MVLALRPWLEPWLGGLDKSYWLHKWLGIASLVASVLHWIFANGPGWLVKLGWMQRGVRGPRSGAASQGVVEQLLSDLRHPAESVGEWAFYAVVLLIALALIKRFPLPALCQDAHTDRTGLSGAGVPHRGVDQLCRMGPAAGPADGSLAGVGRGLRRAGAEPPGRQATGGWGTIEAHYHFPDMNVLETEILLEDGWRGHKSGQFAFVTFDPKEGPHPFTVASAWDAAHPRIVFITKALGDYTDFLPERSQVGNPVAVEGPYGCFTFDDSAQHQIWIGGGIGITPFIARMKQLAKEPGAQTIDLFHSATERAPEALEKLTVDATAARVTLHVMIDHRDGQLTGEVLRKAVPDWVLASVWFCGPAGFGSALHHNLSAHGLANGAFHQELFNMR